MASKAGDLERWASGLGWERCPLFRVEPVLAPGSMVLASSPKGVVASLSTFGGPSLVSPSPASRPSTQAQT